MFKIDDKRNTGRVHASKINLVYSLIFQMLILVMSFVVRSFFIKSLGSSYLGLDGLFKNLLNLLSFTELGLGVAVSSALYEPPANNNIPLIKAYLSLLRRFYKLLIILIIVLGTILTFFLPVFITGAIPSDARLAFILYFMNSAVTYMLVVNRTLLIADQLSYVNARNQFVFSMIQQIIQIIILLATKNYVLYLLIQLLANFASNLSLRRVSLKYYPYLADHDAPSLPTEKIQALKQNIIGMVSSKVGGIVLNSTDNIVLSSFVGLTAVGMFSNYMTVINGLITLQNAAVNAITASIGNLGTESDSHKEENIFFQLFSGNSFVTHAIALGAITFFGKFISVWVGGQYQLSIITTVAIVVLFFMNQLRQISIAFQIAHSLFWQQRFKSLWEAGINLAFSIVFVKAFNLGILGVVLGTITSNILINSWWEPLIVFRSGIQRPLKRYWIVYTGIMVLFLSSMFIAAIISTLEVPFLALCGLFLLHAFTVFTLYFVCFKEFRIFVRRVLTVKFK